jgi:molybdopterin/thiamine biosynthesis adenylyltransferase
MSRFDRQERIAGWDQARLAEACVAVCGRGWVGAFTTWALASMGLGHVAWLGAPERATQPLAETLLTCASPADPVTISEHPCQVDYVAEVEWALHGLTPRLLVHAGTDATEQAACAAFTRARGLPWLAASGSGGGWFGLDRIAPAGAAPEPCLALLLAALLADAVREALCPLNGGVPPAQGHINLPRLPSARPGSALLVGVGGIGVYAATLLAARGWRLHLVDDDRVELSNLNRQGLFQIDDVREGLPKAEAARRALRRWFPHAPVTAEVRRVGRDYAGELQRRRPDVLLSAVDNAATRRLLEHLGRLAGVPVVQGGTDLFAADGFTQDRSGPTLDEQMHGALQEAAAREGARRQGGGCAVDPSYVVPGMVAGAFVASRCVLAAAGRTGLPPLRWRSGELPAETRSLRDEAFDEIAL